MPDPKKFEKQFFAALRDIFVGAKVDVNQAIST